MPGIVYPLARDLRSSIAVQRREQSQNEIGGTLADWVTIIPQRAAKLTPYVPRRGNSEEVIAAALQGTTVYEGWVRYDRLTSTILFSDRLVDLRAGQAVGGEWLRSFNVRWARDVDERRRWIQMVLELGVAQG